MPVVSDDQRYECGAGWSSGPRECRDERDGLGSGKGDRPVALEAANTF